MLAYNKNLYEKFSNIRDSVLLEAFIPRLTIENRGENSVFIADQKQST